MSQYGVCILLVGITITIIQLNGNEKGNKPVTIAMKTIFLNTYCQLIATYGYHKVDETKRTEFMDAWEQIIGLNNAEEMLQNLEPHWMYAVGIVNKSIPDITALVVTTVVKIMALQDGLGYLICVIYYKQAQIDVTPEHCRKRAAYLINFSQLNILFLVPTLLKTRWSAPGFNNTSPDWMHLLSLFAEWKKVTSLSQEVLVTNLQTRQKKYGTALNFKTENSTNEYNIVVDEVAMTHGVCYSASFFAETTLLLIMFGMKECTFSYLANNSFFQWNQKVEIPMWNNALNVDTNDTKGDRKNMEKYFITNLIRENIIWRSELNELSRRDFIEQFEKRKPDNFEIWYEDNRYNNNVLSMTLDTFW